MCGKKVENQGGSSQTLHGFEAFQEQLQHQHQYNEGFIGGMGLPHASSVLSWSTPPVHAFDPVHFSPNPVRDPELFLPSPSCSSSLYNWRPASSSMQFSAYDGSSSNPLGLAGSEGLVPGCRARSSPFNLQAELGRMTTQEMMDAKALAASKSHSEAERRRRERINKHLARLRSLLPNTTKVREKKKKTSLFWDAFVYEEDFVIGRKFVLIFLGPYSP